MMLEAMTCWWHAVSLVPERGGRGRGHRERGTEGAGQERGQGEHGNVTGASESDLAAHAALRDFCLMWRQSRQGVRWWACLCLVFPSFRRNWSVKQQPRCLLSHHPDGYVATSGLTL